MHKKKEADKWQQQNLSETKNNLSNLQIISCKKDNFAITQWSSWALIPPFASVIYYG